MGQSVQVKIIEVDSERRRLSLSIKRVDGDNVKPLRPLEPEPEDDEAEAEAEVEAVAEAAEVVEIEAEEIVEAAAEVAAETSPSEIDGRAVEEPSRPSRTRRRRGRRRGRRGGAAEEVAAEHEPELGLSDDVFPAGGEDDDEPEADAEETPEA